MKIKLIILASLAIGLFAAVGPPSAMAESTQMCEADEEPCTKPAEHFHFTGTITQLHSYVPDVTCNLLFLGNTNGTLESHQTLEGQLTITMCNNYCLPYAEEKEPGEIERSGTELGWWSISVHLVWSCGLTCIYQGIRWHFLGPLNGGGTNGTLTSTHEHEPEEGGYCATGATLETELESLSPIYIKP
jgi:hypothetical protein